MKIQEPESSPDLIGFALGYAARILVQNWNDALNDDPNFPRSRMAHDIDELIEALQEWRGQILPVVSAGDTNDGPGISPSEYVGVIDKVNWEPFSPVSLSHMDDTIVVQWAVVAVKLEHLEDWICLERAEHDGREWMEKTQHGFSYCRAARISDAEVEGTTAEMDGIAMAIRQRKTFLAKRCAVDATGVIVKLWSPRNSQKYACIPLEAARDLAKQIELRQWTEDESD